MRRGIDLLANVIEDRMKSNTAPVAASPATQPPAAALPVPNTEESSAMSPKEQKQLAMLRLQLGMANDSAAEGVPPVEFANGIYDMLPDELIDMLGTDPEWFQVCVNNVPECAQFEQWYSDVKDRIVSLAIEDGILTAPPESGTVSQTPAQAPGASGGTVGDSGKTGTGTPG